MQGQVIKDGIETGNETKQGKAHSKIIDVRSQTMQQ